MIGATRATILAPHLDDAVLSCWSVLTSAAEVRVVNVFAGVPPAGSTGWYDRKTGSLDSAARMRERLGEDAEALTALGREAVNLDFLEDQYRDGADPSPDELLAAVGTHLDGGAVVYVPAGIGRHGDHLLVRSLLGALCRDGTDVRLYADLPYCARYGWPGSVTGAAGDPSADDQWRSALGDLELDVDALSPCTVRLEPAEQERKGRAIAIYRTQFEALTTGGSSAVHMTDPAVLAFEAYWEVTASPPA